MDAPKFGTPEFYKNLFADILADAQCEEPEIGDNLIAGFKMAIDDWRQYHSGMVVEFDRIKGQLDN